MKFSITDFFSEYDQIRSVYWLTKTNDESIWQIIPLSSDQMIIKGDVFDPVIARFRDLRGVTLAIYTYIPFNSQRNSNHYILNKLNIFEN